MGNYSAVVVQIDNIRPHEGADRLQCTTIFGNNIIVGLDTKVGDIGLLFPLESQLGEEFAVANDLLRRKDENGKPAGGLFDQNRRVRAQTLRGEKSMGFFCPIEYLYKLEGIHPADYDFQVGEELETVRGFDIAKKYVVPTKQQSNGGKQGSKAQKKTERSKIVDNQFRFHMDTAQLGRNLHKVSPDDLISITWKLHGTSMITSNLLTTKKLKWYEKLAKSIGIPVVDAHYDYVYASRKVIKGVEGNIEEAKNHNHFYGLDLWGEAGKSSFYGKLHKGESVYAEIVGFTPTGSPIQKPYDYGCGPKEYKVYIYRITQTNVDGVVTELPWYQVVHRAKELGQNTVPEIYYGDAQGFAYRNLDSWETSEDYRFIDGTFGFNYTKEERFSKIFLDVLQKYYVHDQDCQFCKNKVPSEGVVVRVERGDGIENFKLKNFRFLKDESKSLDKGEVDMESSQDEQALCPI